MSTKELHLTPSEINLSNEKSFPQPIYEKKSTQPKPDPETGKTEKPQQYNEAPLIYKHYNKQTKKYEKQDRWLVQGPVMKSRGGLVWEKKGNRWGCYILCNSLDLKTEGMLEFLGNQVDLSDWMKMPEVSTDETVGRDSVGLIMNLYLRCAEGAYTQRKSLGMEAVKKPDGMEGVFKCPIKYPTDAQGNLIEGASPSAFWKVFLLGDPSKKTTRKATFSVPSPDTTEGEIVLPWEYLQDADIEFQPLFNFKKIYAGGGKGSIQIEIISAVVLSLVRLNTKGEQKDLIAKYNKNEQLTSKLADQLAQMAELMGNDSAFIPKKKSEDTKNIIPPKKGGAKLLPKKKDDDSGSDSNGDDEPASPVKKAPLKKGGLTLPKKNEIKDLDDVSDESEEVKPKNKKLLLPKKKVEEVESDEDSSKKNKKKDDDEDEEVAPPPKDKKKVEKKKIVEEDNDSEPKKKDDDEDEDPKPKPKKVEKPKDEEEVASLIKDKKKVEKKKEEEEEKKPASPKKKVVKKPVVAPVDDDDNDGDQLE